MTDFIEPLDLKKIIIDYLLGTSELFIVALTIFLSIMCAKFRMTTRNYLILLVISSLIFSVYLGQAVYILVVLIVGLISFKSISRMISE